MATRPGYIWSGTEWIDIGQSAVVSPFKYQASQPSSPSTGDIWIDSDEDVPSVDSTLYYRWTKTMSGGETSLSGTDNNSLSLQYTPGYESVFINGVLQARNLDYTATSGSTISGLTALVANDIVMVESIVAYSVGDTYTQSTLDGKFATQLNFPAGAWTSYTPTFTNLTVGNGTINAAYNQIGKTVNVRISFTWGSTTSANSSTTIVSLPVTAKNVGTSYGAGTAYMENSGIAGYITGVVMNTASNTFVSTVIGTNGLVSTNVTGQQPFTWGVGDFFQTIFTYEAA